jgi:glutaredoxin 2
MELKFYHYVHCPFCVRVRMTLGLLDLPYESVVVSYDDEITPVKLTGTKMLPIMSIDGKVMNESLDIMAKLDTGNSG